MGKVTETSSWPETVAFFLALGFDVRPENIGSMMRKCPPVRDRLSTCRQYVQRGTVANSQYWRAKFENFNGIVSYTGPRFNDPISAFVHAEVENWGR